MIDTVAIGQDLPHTKHKINSIVASFSLDKLRLIAIADCATRMVPR